MANPDKPAQTTTLRDSTVFPEGYGDVAIQSSDGEIFHFPGFLLAYSSPVFKDMFELAARAREDVGEQRQTQRPKKTDPILLSEDAITICGFLLHIDPVKMPLPINTETIKPLLEAARKYQLPTILQWFEREVTNVDASQVKVYESKSLIENDPLFFLSLATEYGSEELVPKAILAAANGGPIEESDDLVDIKHYRLIHRLRQKRIERYLALIHELAELSGSIEPTSCPCGTTYSSWLIHVTKAILEEPLWKSFIGAIESHERCSIDWSGWFRSHVYDGDMEAKLRRQEHELPKSCSSFGGLFCLLSVHSSSPY